MNIKTVYRLCVSVIVADCMLNGASAYADVPAQSAIAMHGAVSVKPVIKKEDRKLAKAERARAKDIYDPEMPDESMRVAAGPVNYKLQGSATFVNMSGRFNEAVHSLTKTALERDPEYLKTAKLVDHYRTKVQRAVRFTKDAVNYVYPYRGFSMSIEGAKVILDKPQKMNNLFVCELAKQRYWDETHSKVTAQIMQIAMGLGMEKSEQSDKIVKTGVDNLTKMVGEEAANATVAELTEWKNQVNVPDSVFQQSAWDVDTTERIYRTAQKTSADGDPLISHIFKRVGKFNHGKAFNFTASVVESNLSALTVLSGNPMISLAAEGLNTAFVMGTGGPEENKILKELYYGRRLEIRRKRINEETELALTNYEKALLTHNLPQLAMSEVVLSQLVGPERVGKVLERDALCDFGNNAPIELAKGDKD